MLNCPVNGTKKKLEIQLPDLQLSPPFVEEEVSRFF
jgi:hypothetical protein